MSWVRFIVRFLPELILTIGLALGEKWVWIFLVAAVVVFFMIKARD